jgi:uncharacterized delta-60 repeat protein
MLHQRTKAVTGDDTQFFLILPQIAPWFIFEALERRLMWSVTPTDPDVGVRDESFGNGGIVVSDVTGGPERAQKVLVQNDGKPIVVAWSGSVFNLEMAGYIEDSITLVRYNLDGSLDNTFGNGGVVTVPAENLTHARYDISDLPAALQADGKIVVGGAAVYRFNADGSLDTSFGDNGVARREGSLLIEALAVAPDGKIIISTHYGFVFERYNVDGTIDTTFGDNGVVAVDYLGRPNDEKLSAYGGVDIGEIIVQRDGKLVAVANFREPPMGRWINYAVLRLNEDGSNDTSFGNGGVVHTRFPEDDSDDDARVAIQSDGKIILAGMSGRHLARYNADGSLDASFGDGGLVFTPDTADTGDTTGVAIQANGKILVAGNDGAMRFNPDGTLDRVFVGGGDVTASSVALAPDGGIFISAQHRAVWQFNGPDDPYDMVDEGGDIVLARFLGDPLPVDEPDKDPTPPQSSQANGTESEIPASVFADVERGATQSFFTNDDNLIGEKEDELFS